MAALVPLSVSAPGFLGLNKQNSGDVLPPGWATKADNLVIDEVGRLAKRKGTTDQSTDTLTGVDIAVQHVYLDKTGAEVRIVAQGNKIYTSTLGGAFTDVTGTITTPTADNWKFQNFNGKVVGWQTLHNPIVMATVGGSFADIVAGAGTVPIGNEVLAAWGRLWVLDDDTLHYSDLLSEVTWSGGTAGSTLLTNVWPNGVDIPVGLAEFNGHLVIFGKDSVVVFAGPDDPASAFSTFAKVEGIHGTGLASRDLKQNIGKDLVFVSPDGVRTLGRTIQEKSMPSNDAAPQVRDWVVSLVQNATDLQMKSAFSKELGLMIVTFDVNVLAIDVRSQLEDGAFRVTSWPVSWTGVTDDRNGSFLLSTEGSGQSQLYSGELDGIPQAGSGGSDIVIDYEGAWGDFATESREIGANEKMLKRVKLYLYGGLGATITFKWATDYSTDFNVAQLVVSGESGTAIWDTDNWDTGIWGAGATFKELASNITKSGRVVKFGITGSIAGVPIALNRIDLFAKIGKLSI